MNNLCRIQTGDRVGADWTGPRWTPFAQAIANNYGASLPWFYNELVTLAATPTRQTVLTPPQINDVLIVGAHVQSALPERLPFVYLQVTHQESGVQWAAPTVLPFFPLTAFAGVNGNAMPNLKLPEAFFLPAHTQLKLDWTLLGNPAFVDTTTLRLTLLGVQLVGPRGGRAPERVTMPNGQQVRTDGRLPLFMTMGVGRRGPGGVVFIIGASATEVVQYLPPIDCDVEIHDACSNLISPAFDFINVLQGTSFLNFKITIMGAENQWTPYLSPLITIFGGQGGGTGGATLVYPALPYTKPYLLLKGQRIQVAQQNNNALEFINGDLTFRGVRLCEY
jgi:hypothetical protein